LPGGLSCYGPAHGPRAFWPTIAGGRAWRPARRSSPPPISISCTAPDARSRGPGRGRRPVDRGIRAPVPARRRAPNDSATWCGFVSVGVIITTMISRLRVTRLVGVRRCERVWWRRSPEHVSVRDSCNLNGIVTVSAPAQCNSEPSSKHTQMYRSTVRNGLVASRSQSPIFPNW
jgi:hypothetical protein